MRRRINYMGATTPAGLRHLPLQWWDSLTGARHGARDSALHLKATMEWLARAQDAGDDDGVSRMYHIHHGWGASYPETTGYIIPTFLHYAAYAGDDDYIARALRMARWESRVQMDDGAVQGGVVSEAPTPAIFNTGQVLFGWCAAYDATDEVQFRESALRSADYLVEQMDSDGAWRRNLSAYTSTSIDTYAYNVRNAWALLIADGLDTERGFRRAALRNVEFVLGLCHENGWIEKNCLGRPEQPLLHTIAYAYQGLLECAEREALDDAFEMVVRGNRALVENQQQFGSLHGRYDASWNPTVRWRCLTGEAQTAIVWRRLAQVTGDASWNAAADALVSAVKRTQVLTGAPGVAGGIKGSQPITAPYGRFQYLNWAAKFFADALMLEVGVPDAALAG